MNKNKGKILTIAMVIVMLCVSIIYPSALTTSTGTEITSCESADEGRLLINWTKVNVDGYELMLAQNDRFTRNAQTLTYSGDKQKASLSKLDKNIIYYMKIRTFNVENGQKVYSAWSSVKSERVHAHDYRRTMTTRTTCTQAGVYTYVCNTCGKYYKESVPAATSHSYKWINNGNDTMSYKCQVCGDVKETKNCNYVKTATVKATCTSTGYTQYECSDCGATKKETINKSNHTYNVTKDTSTEKTYTCTVCGDTYTEKKNDQNTESNGNGNKNESDNKNENKTDESVSNIDKEYTIDLGNGKTTTVTGHYDEEMANEIFTQLNDYRESKGLAALKKGSTALQNAANIRATEITYYFNHYRPNGERALISFTGSTGCCAENIAKYQKTATEVMKDWKNSSGHNANMISKYPTSISISVFAKYNGTLNGKRVYSYYFVQFFGW